MTITRCHRSPRMSQAVVRDDLVWLAGQVGTPQSDITAQTRESLAAVDALLAEVGSEGAHLSQVVIWPSDMADFDAINAVYDAWINPDHAPVRAYGEARLAAPEYRVEVIVTAAPRA